MSLAQGKASKRYVAAHREQYLKMMRDNYDRKKEEYIDKNNKRSREITAGAQRWRKTVGMNYWDLLYGTDLDESKYMNK